MHDDTTADGTDASDDRPTDVGTPLASRRDVLKAAGAGAAATGLGASALGTASASSHGINTPWLHVEGNKVLDPLGNEVVLRGLNIPDPKRLDHSVAARGKNWDHLIDLATNEERGWYANVIRIPVHPGDIAELPPVPEADVDVHMPPTFTQDELLDYCENYLDPVVQHCWEQNVYCIVDYHRHWGEGELEWTNDDLDEEVQMFWDTVAPRYAEDPHVIFEVYNEPTQPAMYGPWPDGQQDTWQLWKDTAQPWVDTIREHAPENLIVVGNPGWSSQPEGVLFEEFDGGNLMYTYHIYGGHGLRSEDDYDGREAAEGTAGVWEDVPLFTTEFGWEPDAGDDGYIAGTTDDFGEAIYEWMDNRPIHWTAWCFDITWLPSMWERAFVEDDPDDSVGDPYSGDIPELCEEPPCEWNLLGEDVGAYDEYQGGFVKDWLEERKDDDLPQVDYDPNPPAVPPNLSASNVTEKSVTLSWGQPDNPGDSPFSHYTVYVEGEQYVETEETSVTLDDLLSDSDLQVSVTAWDSSGNESDPATVEVTTDPIDDDAPPGSPQGVTLADRTYHSLTLTWEGAQPNGSDVFEYVVYFEGEEVARLEDEVTEYRFEDLEAATQYDVAVSAFDRAKNESAPTELVVETRADYAVEGDLLVNDYDGSTDGGENELGNWTGGGLNQGVEDGVMVWEWSGTDYYGTTVNQDVSDYPELRLRARGEEGGEESSLSIDVGGTSAGLSQVSDDSFQTEFDVFAIDLSAADWDLAEPGTIQFDGQHGSSGRVEVAELWFAAEDDPEDGVIERGGTSEPPSAPSTVSAANVTATTIDLTWDGVLNATGYEVFVDDEAVDDVATTSTTVTGLSPETTYELAVRAYNGEGQSDLTTTSVQTATDGGEGCDDLPTETVDGQTVCDVDEDGYYRDVTADGDLAQDDVVSFFEVQHRSAWKRSEFDFSGNGEVNQFDVVELFDYVLTQG